MDGQWMSGLGWMDGWMNGWMDGQWMSGLEDCCSENETISSYWFFENNNQIPYMVSNINNVRSKQDKIVQYMYMNQ